MPENGAGQRMGKMAWPGQWYIMHLEKVQKDILGSPGKIDPF
jgi:hypothetical protein